MVKGLPVEWGMCYRTVIPDKDKEPLALTNWKDTIATGLSQGKIITFDGIAGSQMTVLSGHTGTTTSLAFSLDGTLLVSGSLDRTIKLWDVQTGGVIKTLCGHKHWVYCVSISADSTMIASGSGDTTIHLWDIQTGECHHVIKQQVEVQSVCFSPIDPQYLISGSDQKLWQWNVNGQQINPPHNGSHVSFSSDGTQFVSCQEEYIVVQNSGSQTVVAKLHAAKSIGHCCFSSDGRFIAAAANNTAYVWDTTSLNPHPIKTFIGHTRDITALAFSSPYSLISSSRDKSVKFWKIGAPLPELAITNMESMTVVSTLITAITLQAKDGIAISSNSDGVVRTWDISTGLCNAYFQTPAGDAQQCDIQLINRQLIFVWREKTCYWDAGKKVHIWDVEKGKLQAMGIIQDDTEGSKHFWDGTGVVNISEDGTKVFCLHQGSIQALSTKTGEVVGRVKFKYDCDIGSLTMTVDGSRVWVHFPSSEPLGWDFGTPDAFPVQISNMPQPYLNHTKMWDVGLSRIVDTVTGKVVFQLDGKFAKPTHAQWDGQYLVAGYLFGEVLILDFNCVP